MRIKGKRVFNYRPMLFFALAMILGIIVSEAFYGLGVWWYVALFILFILVFLLVTAFKKSRKFFYIPLALIVGFVAMTSVNLQYNSIKLHNYSGEMTARVNSEVVLNGDYFSFDADQITVDGERLRFGARVYAHVENVDFSSGDTVKLYGNLRLYEHRKFDYRYPRKVSSGQRYNLSAFGVVKIAEGRLGFPQNLQVRVKRILHQNLDDKTASIVQALVLGDKSGIDSSMYDSIKSSGLAHVLAVSGLHVTTLAAAIFFLLKKLKVNPKIGCCIVLVATFLYSMLCSFTPSSLRAVIMSGVYMVSSVFSKKRDDLSSLSLAAILILMIRPADVFDVGFLLSFASVTGIFLFNRTFERAGMKLVEKVSPKRKIGTRFAKVCAISFATNLFTFPFVAYFFKEVPTLFVLSNFLVLPYIMVFYVLSLILVFLATLTGVGAIVLPLKYLLVPFRLFVGLVGSVSFATVSVSASVFMVVALVLTMILTSRFVFLTKTQKAKGACIILCIGLILRSLFVLV